MYMILQFTRNFVSCETILNTKLVAWTPRLRWQEYNEQTSYYFIANGSDDQDMKDILLL